MPLFEKGNVPWIKGRKGIFSGEKSATWKGGRPKCIDCGTQLASYKAKRCDFCAGKYRSGKNSSSWKGGIPKCVDCGKQLSKYKAKRCHPCLGKANKGINTIARMPIAFYKKISLKGITKQQTMKEPTSIEKKLYQELKNRGLLFEKQKLINGRFLVDAYIPSLNLVIEADGDYWHSLDRVVKKDKAENVYLTKCGYKLLRLSESEINSGKFTERLVV